MSARGITQEALAKETHKSQGAVSGWLRGVVPKGEALASVAKFFGVTVEQLLTGEHQATYKMALRPDEVAHQADVIMREGVGDYSAAQSAVSDPLRYIETQHLLAAAKKIAGMNPSREQLCAMKQILEEIDRRVPPTQKS